MATNAIAPRKDTANNPIALFQQQLEERAKDIRSALPAHITPDKFQRTVMTAVAQNPDLLKADRQSLILACYKAAQDALLPDGREAALVVYNTRQKINGQWQTVRQVQYLPMAFGIRKKILQSGMVAALEVNVVYRAEVERGTFLYEVGLEPPLRHRPSLDLSDEETTDDQICAAYSIATMKDGTKSFEVMRRFEINKVREASQTGATLDRNGQPREAKGPWVDWFAEMAKKTVLRRHAKTLPMSGDLLIDVEGTELEMRGTAAALNVAPDAPKIEDHSDETEETAHDAETGEIREDADTPAEAKGGEEPEDITADTEADATDPDAKDPADDAVDRILAGFAKAETLIDLNKLKAEADKHTPFMSELHQETIDGGYNRHKKRLTKAKAEPESAK